MQSEGSPCNLRCGEASLSLLEAAQLVAAPRPLHRVAAAALVGMLVVAAAALGLPRLAAGISFADGAGAPRAVALEAVNSAPQFIAALGSGGASSGTGAEHWGLWRLDPGPRGVQLSDVPGVLAAGGLTPAGWKVDSQDWWLEEHGLVMEQPDTPLPAGRYRVTGGGPVADLTVEPQDSEGQSAWRLEGASLGEVTHGPCRAARYTPASAEAEAGACSPENARQSAFPVAPGAAMPPVDGCSKQDFRVLIVVGAG